MTLAYVSKHSLCFGRVADGLTGDGVKSIHLNYIPAFRLCVKACTARVCLGTFGLDLPVRTHSQPYTNPLYSVRLLPLHAAPHSTVTIGLC